MTRVRSRRTILAESLLPLSALDFFLSSAHAAKQEALRP